ncbi:MAG: choloylglycine hydrolase [Clostridia bacterium]|nr:choloylglycine hydrolase [Clostridia bacterium]
MCTAITYKTKNHYFGRNLDLDYSYHESVTVTPRNYSFKFRKTEEMKTHYAIIGMANVEDNFPLYYDAINEKGLGMAALSYFRNVDFKECTQGKFNIAPFEFIPWILGQCADLEDAKKLLANINLAKICFNEKFPISPVHWIISDKNSSVTVEAVKEGVMVYDNPVGVLTNDPSFDMQLFNLNNYMNLTPETPENTFSDKIDLFPYCKGMGAVGLPGDLSSPSRFVKATFTKLNSVCEESESESISQFFHILGSVYQQRGSVRTGKDKYEITYYSSCCNQDTGIYYYTTYENSQITAVNMNNENLDGKELAVYPLIRSQQINYING